MRRRVVGKATLHSQIRRTLQPIARRRRVTRLSRLLLPWIFPAQKELRVVGAR